MEDYILSDRETLTASQMSSNPMGIGQSDLIPGGVSVVCKMQENGGKSCISINNTGSRINDKCILYRSAGLVDSRWVDAGYQRFFVSKDFLQF